MIILVLCAIGVVIYGFSTNSLKDDATIATALVAAAAAVLNWTYQSGSRRIGAVDLFACEISALCRVSLVINFAQTCVDRAERAHEAMRRLTRSEAEKPSDNTLDRPDDGEPVKFTSEEDYTPVYDGNISDLEPLDVNVVTYVTEFYTYRKTMVDHLRAITRQPSRRKSNGFGIR